MELYESLRLKQAKIISDNPVSIIINRISRTYDGSGGFVETTSTLPVQLVRIYAKNKRVLNIAAGGFVTSKITKMLALYTADIESESETFLDTFIYGGKTYKISYVEDVTTQGYVCWCEAEVEEIK